MSIFSLFIIIAVVLILILVFPDLFPICSCCGRIKLRVLFQIHKTVSIKIGYGSYKSLCKKCCRVYSLNNISDLDRLAHVIRKVELDMYRPLEVSAHTKVHPSEDRFGSRQRQTKAQGKAECSK